MENMNMGIPRDILEEAIEILEQSEILKGTAIWTSDEIEKFVSKYSDEEFDELPWDEKEEVSKTGEELMGRMKVSINELKKLSNRYEGIRKRLKEEYNDDRLPPLRDKIEDLLGEDDDEGEDWKK